MTDPISDFTTRLRNASIAAILKAEGYISDVRDGTDIQGHKTLIVKMKYVDGAPAITAINRTSTPGRRIYAAYSEVPRVLNGLGIAIVSTSRGLMKDADCRRNKAGGELICNVW
jgi:small subunit ribosomal protein S8